MAFPIINSPLTVIPGGLDLTRLETILVQSKVQTDNPPLYQTILGLLKNTQAIIKILNENINAVNTVISGGHAGITELTTDVLAGPGTGAQVATIATHAVTYAKMQAVTAPSKLLGRESGSAGDVEEITLGTNLSMSGTTLNATGGGGGGFTPGSIIFADSGGNLGEDNPNLFFDNTNDRVGIRTNVPARVLHIVDDAQEGFRIERVAAVARKWDFYIAADGHLAYYDATAGADRLSIGTDNTVHVGASIPGGTQPQLVVDGKTEGSIAAGGLTGAPTNGLAVLGRSAIGNTGSAGSMFEVQGTMYSSVAETNTVFNGDPNSTTSASYIGPSGYWAIRSNTSHAFNLDVYHSGTPRTALQIQQTGDAVFSDTIEVGSFTFANLPTPATGMYAIVTDSSTNTPGDTITGGGTDTVFAWYDGTNWLVMGGGAGGGGTTTDASVLTRVLINT